MPYIGGDDKRILCLGQASAYHPAAGGDETGIGDTDSAYRYGGEEFTILLPMSTIEDGVITAERIRTQLKKEIFPPASGNKDIHIKVSIGLTQYKPNEDMRVFVQRVDQLMYQAKKNGKDSVCSKPRR